MADPEDDDFFDDPNIQTIYASGVVAVVIDDGNVIVTYGERRADNKMVAVARVAISEDHIMAAREMINAAIRKRRNIKQ